MGLATHGDTPIEWVWDEWVWDEWVWESNNLVASFKNGFAKPVAPALYPHGWFL